MERQGSAAIIVAVIGGIAVLGGIALASSPDTAQQVLPGQLLAMHPQFEAVSTDANCTQIRQGTELANDWVPDALTGGEDIDPAAVKTELCGLQCDSTEAVGGTYCSDTLLNCVCRTGSTSSQ